MIPDKIYLYREKPKDYFDEDWHESSASDVENVEYIRKDALLEWAKGEQVKCSSETHPYAMFMNVVIDKLNSM